MSKIFPVGSVAVVLGSSGGIGRAIRDNLVKQNIFYDVIQPVEKRAQRST